MTRAEPSEALAILRACTYQIHHGGCQRQGMGITGQLTECAALGTRFYVREGLGGVDHFYISANARIGMKEGRAPKGSVDTLHLCAPDELWERLAELVRQTDPLGRPVVRHRRFTARWAEETFTRAAERGATW